MLQSFNRMSGELYYRFPTNKNLFGLTRFSFSADRDERNEKKVLDSGTAMAAFKLGPVNSVSEGKIVWFNHDRSADTGEAGLKLDSYKITQSLTWTIHGSISKKSKKTDSTPPTNSAGSGERKKAGGGKKGLFTIVLSSRTSYEKAVSREGIWAASFSASLRTGKNRVTVKAATAAFPKKWEFTLSWRLLF